ncbi:MAG: hypothetical protein ACKOWG_10535 [Planctomycetia bacterium]
MPEAEDRLHDLLVSLTSGARRHAARDAAARGRLARACAERVAELADDWARTAVAVKQGGDAAADHTIGSSLELTWGFAMFHASPKRERGKPLSIPP